MNRPSSQGRVYEGKRIFSWILLLLFVASTPFQALAESTSQNSQPVSTAQPTTSDQSVTQAKTTKTAVEHNPNTPPVDDKINPALNPPTDDGNSESNNVSVASSMALKPDQVSGALVYKYPITLPPGRNHLQPDLSLIYNNQSAVEGGIVGYGWSINLPYIERSNRKGSEVLYDPNYGPYFDSSISGNLVTADGVTYHPEVDDGSFLRYSFDGASWIVADKNGNTFKYGTSLGARQVDPNNTDHVYRWYLEEERDANDNYIRYTYTEDAGQMYPSTIYYTGHGSTDGAVEVDFGLQARTDTPRLFSTGFQIRPGQRVSSITVKTNGVVTRSYTLSYATSTESARSLLKSVVETGYDAAGNSTTLPPTTFTYTTAGSANWTLDDWDYDHTNNFAFFPHEVLDVFNANGDALPDIMKSYPDYEPGGAIVYNKAALRGWDPDYDASLPSTFMTSIHFSLGDYNGDGYLDLMQDQRYHNAPAYGPQDYFNDGNGNWTIQPALAPPGTDHAYADNSYSGFATADVNGDGLDDILLNSRDSQDGSRTFINEGTNGWSERGWYTPRISLFPWSSVPATFADLNDDGLADLTYQYNTLAININNGAKDWNGDPGTWNIPPNLGFLYRNLHTASIADVNGDGLPDLLAIDPNTGAPLAYLDKADGTGWETTPDPRFAPPYNFSDANEVNMFMDVNGDGIADIIGFNDIRGFVYTNHATRSDLLSKINLSSGGSNKIEYQQSPRIQDDSGTTQNPKLPTILNVVSSIVTDNGIGTFSTTTYSYVGGQFYYATSTPPAPYERKFAGFSKVIETDPDGSVTDTYYHQGNGDDAAHGEHGDDPAKIGHPYRIETYDQAGHLFRVVTNKWGIVVGTASSTFTPLLQTTASDYDGDSDHIDKAETYSYNNANGDLTEKTEWGQVTAADDGSFTDTGTDKFVTDTAYATSTTTPLSVPDQVTTVDQSSTTVRQTTNYYDTLGFGSAVKGNLTKQLKWITGTTTAETDTTYNSYGLVTQTKDPRGNATNYSYDSYNLYPATTTNALGYSSAALYDYSLGKPSQVTNENGVTLKTLFDGLDRVIEQDEPDPLNASSTVPKSQFLYSDYSMPRSVKETNFLNSGTSTISYTYLDGFDRVVQKLVEAEGSNYAATTNTYDSRGLLHTESLPYFVTSTSYSGTSSPPAAALLTTYSYDALQRPVSVANTLGTTTNAYDQWQVTATDANGHAHDYLKDAYGNLKQVVEHNDDGNYTTSYQYDGNHNLTQLTDANGNIRKFGYDGLGRRTSAEDLHVPIITSPTVWTYSYDAAGNLTSQKDPKNQTTNFTYDALNRPLTEDYTGASGTEVSYGYDSCAYGKMQLCVATTSDAIDSYTYTPLGARASESAKIAGQTYTTSYTYDRLGNKTLITYPDSSQVQYVYNAAGLLDSINQKPSGGSFSSLVQNFDYAPIGKVSYEQFANGVTSSYTYDANQLYRLTKILTIGSTTPGGMAFVEPPQKPTLNSVSGDSNHSAPVVSSSPNPGTVPAPSSASSPSKPSLQNQIDKAIEAASTASASSPSTKVPSVSTQKKQHVGAPAQLLSGAAIQNISYAYDAVGNITSITDYSSTQAAHVSNFTYDYLNRLKSASTTAASSTPYSQTYTYNKIGDITNKSDLGAYTYTGGNNANPDAPNTIAGNTLKYDKDGNLTKYAGNPFTWDYRNRLTSIFENGATSTYAYDFQNNRVKRVVGTSTPVTTLYPSDLYNVSSSTATRNVFTTDGTLIATISGTSTLATAYIHPDNLGSTNVTTDASGTLSETSDYYPYGSQRLDTGTTQQRKYIGEEYDPESSLSYLNARYYEGARGQFLSQDPVFNGDPNKQNLKDPQSLNAYSYAENNPITQNDPNGQSVKTFVQGVASSIIDAFNHPLQTGEVLVAAAGVAIAAPVAAAATGAFLGGYAIGTAAYNAATAPTADVRDYYLGQGTTAVGLTALGVKSGEGVLNLQGNVAQNGSYLPSISTGNISNDAKTLLTEYQSNGWTKAQSGPTGNPHPFILRTGELPANGTIFDAQYTTASGRGTDRFIKADNGHIYYTNNHYGDEDNGEPPFYKIYQPNE